MVPVAHAATQLAAGRDRRMHASLPVRRERTGQREEPANGCGRHSRNGKADASDELREQRGGAGDRFLGGLALEGAALVSLDNISAYRAFGGAPLERAITTPGDIKFRILGLSKTPALPWLTVVSATGNNVSFTPDMARRALVSRLESLEANPEARNQVQVSTPARSHPAAPR